MLHDRGIPFIKLFARLFLEKAAFLSSPPSLPKQLVQRFVKYVYGTFSFCPVILLLRAGAVYISGLREQRDGGVLCS